MTAVTIIGGGFWPLGVCIGVELGIAYGSCFKGPWQRRYGALLGWLIAVLWLSYEWYSGDDFLRQPIDLAIKEGDRVGAIGDMCVAVVFTGIIGALVGSWIGSRYAVKTNQNTWPGKE